MAVQYAESLGWRFEKASGHAWGFLKCPQATRQGCIVAVYSTPKSAGNHARQVCRKIDRCPHQDKPATRQEQDQ